MSLETNALAFPQGFPQTRWTVVLAAAGTDALKAQAALESLYRAYWPPLYAWVRRQGRSPHDAQDLTQAFFVRLLENDWVAAVRRDRGRFRSFLLVAFKRFLRDEWLKLRAQKRGGGQEFLPLDTEVGERLYHARPDPGADDSAFDREWAMTLLERALGRLREEFETAGKQVDYAVLKDYLTADRGDIPYEQLAAQLETTPGAARLAIHRLRKRFRDLFRDEVGQTVAREEDVEDEARQLLRSLR